MSRTFRVLVVMVALLGMCVSLMVPWRFRTLEKRQLMEQFRREVDARAMALDREVGLNLEVLFSLKSLFTGSEKVEKREFATVAAEALQRHPDIHALAWVPYVPESQRGSFETSLSADRSSAQFFEIAADGRRVIAGRRHAHFPLYFMEPKQAAIPYLGLDLAADPACLKLLDAARDAGVVQVFGNFKISDLAGSRQTFLGILPVSADKTSGTLSHGDGLRGFIVGIFDYTSMFQRAGWNDFPALSEVRLVDDSHPDMNRELFVYHRDASAVTPTVFTYQREVKVPGQKHWQLQAEPVVDYFSRYQSMAPWLYVLIGILISLAVPFYLILMARHAASVEVLVSRRTSELDEANRKLASLSLTDGLTSIANRRYFDDHLDQEWKRAIRDRQPLSLIMVDIDQFKAYNDYYGHLAGDDCLRQVARVLNGIPARPGDLVARYGGEEFALILPKTNDGALALGEKCRAAVAGANIPHHASFVKPVVTVSVGVATVFPQMGSEPAQLILLADQALYRAKLRGRNLVVVETVFAQTAQRLGQSAEPH